jgi:succinate dehydrogenase / fumarate reductase membrane anchor subunit
MVNRIVVGAHYGVKDWLIQRISAIVMAIYAILFGLTMLSSGPLTYTTWKALFSQGWMRVATLFFVLSILLHAWVGVRDVFMDYIKNTGLRLALQVLTVLWLVGCGGWALQILWRI